MYRLRPGNVHVWVIDLDGPAPPDDHLGCLSDDERARAARFRFQNLARRFCVGHAALRQLLGRYGAGAPAAIRFGVGAHGRPFVVGRRLDFNFSHSDGLAVCAVTRRGPVGVDVEKLRPVPDAAAIVRRNFSPREQQMLAGWGAAEDSPAFQQAFAAGWTRKEAFIKAIGRGLSQPLDAFSVTLLPVHAPRILQPPPDRPGPWSLLSFVPADGYLGALVVRGRGVRASVARWRG